MPLAAAVPLPAQADVAAPPELCGRYVDAGPHHVLQVWGTPRQRGFAHGYLLADEIVRAFEVDFARVMGERIARYDATLARVVVPRFAFSDAETATLAGMLAGIRARLPEERQVVSVLKRRIELVDLKALNTFADWFALGCSTIAAWGEHSADGRPVVARNFDFTAFESLLRHSHVVVAAAREGVAGHVGIAYPGCVGVITGMNEAGVWASIHDVWVRPTLVTAMRPNVPRLCAMRRLLERLEPGRACADALARTREWRTLFGNNFMIVDPEPADGQPHASVLEYDNRRKLDEGAVARWLDHAGAERASHLLCTNHHRARGVDSLEDLTDCPRYRALAAAIGAPRRAPRTVADLFELIDRAAVPAPDLVVSVDRDARDERTFGTLHQVVGLTGRRELHVRFVADGANIRDAEIRRYAVAELLAEIRALQSGK